MRHTHFIDVNQLINIISGGVEYLKCNFISDFVVMSGVFKIHIA